jgi:hypothetical protein
MARLLACPGSFSADPGLDEPSSSFAEEGTAAHDLAANWLALALLTGGGDFPWEAEVDDPDRIEAVRHFVDYCCGLQPFTNYGIERELKSETVEDFGGTPDFFCYQRDTNHAYIVDYKHGQGVPVVAEKNAQLLSYAVLLLEAMPKIETFTLVIIQPRTAGEPVDEWGCDRKTVLEFRKRIESIGQSDELRINPGCRWCPALTTCSAVRGEAFRLAKYEFDGDAQRLQEIYQVTPAILALLKAVPGRMLSSMEKGVGFPGLKAVQTLKNRTWIADEAATLAALQRKKVKVADATIKKLKSPAQLEKVAGKELIASLCHRPAGGLSIVPESDKRPGVVFETPEETFVDVSL